MKDKIIKILEDTNADIICIEDVADEILDLFNLTHWVATSDNLPEDGKEVIVWLPDVKDHDMDSINDRYSREVFKRSYSHWCEKPEPPCG